MANDPHRTLGLKPGATPVEIKRAYRALAKANHPDSAGDAALVRFLAIQAAYEQLIGAKGQPPTRGRSASSPAQSWRADPERARESKSRGRSDPAGSSGSRGPRPAGSPGSRPGAPSDRPPGGGSRRRSTKKATFGSTTYDEARETADPTWQGASWYGPSSGEFWTVNPREYADPRKHGPEYLSRAAERAARASARAGAREDPATARAPDFRGDPSPADEPQNEARAEAEAAAWAAREARSEAAAAAEAARQRAADRAAAARARRRRARVSDNETGPPAGPIDLGLESAMTSLWKRLERSPHRRLLLALLAWPPLGIAAAALIGDATGCASFSATCTTAALLYPWLAQAALIGLLLLIPGVARMFVGGTIAVFGLVFPVTAILVRRDGPFDPAYGPTALMGIMAIAWLGGVGLAALLRVRGRWAR